MRSGSCTQRSEIDEAQTRLPSGNPTIAIRRVYDSHWLPPRRQGCTTGRERHESQRGPQPRSGVVRPPMKPTRPRLVSLGRGSRRQDDPSGSERDRRRLSNARRNRPCSTGYFLRQRVALTTRLTDRVATPTTNTTSTVSTTATYSPGVPQRYRTSTPTPAEMTTPIFVPRSSGFSRRRRRSTCFRQPRKPRRGCRPGAWPEMGGSGRGVTGTAFAERTAEGHDRSTAARSPYGSIRAARVDREAPGC